MKSILIFSLAVLVSATACQSNNKKQTEEQKPVAEAPVVVAPVPVVTKELTGYFLKNTYKQEEDIKLLIIKDETRFNELFGMAKTMTNEILKPDFGTTIVAAVAIKSTKAQTTIKIDKAEIEGEILNAYVTVEKGAEQSFTTTPVYLFVFEKGVSAKQIQLLVNGEKKEIVEL